MKDYLRFDLTEQVRREQMARRLKNEAALVILGFTLGALLTVLIFTACAWLAR